MVTSRGLAGPGRSRRLRRPNAFECLQLRRSTSFDWCWWGWFRWLFRPGKDFWSINHSLWGTAFEQSTSTAKPDDEMQTVASPPPLCFEDRFWSISIFKGCMKCGDAAEFVAFMAELWHANYIGSNYRYFQVSSKVLLSCVLNCTLENWDSYDSCVHKKNDCTKLSVAPFGFFQAGPTFVGTWRTGRLLFCHLLRFQLKHSSIRLIWLNFRSWIFQCCFGFAFFLRQTPRILARRATREALATMSQGLPKPVTSVAVKSLGRNIRQVAAISRLACCF